MPDSERPFGKAFRDALTESLSDPQWISLADLVDDDVIDQLERFATSLVRMNQQINLTSITNPVDVAVKHVLDSLSALTVGRWPGGARVCDVGTGGGVPGVVLRIARPDLEVTLIDSVKKKLQAVQHICDELKLSVATVHGRAEELGHDVSYRGSFHVVTARAVARLPVLLEFCLPLVTIGGQFVALKGPQVGGEVEASSRALQQLGGEVETIRPITLPGGAGGRTLIVVRKTSVTPARFPRKPGIPAKNPL